MKFSHTGFYLKLLNSMHPCYDGDGRTCKILFHLHSLGHKVMDEDLV